MRIRRSAARGRRAVADRLRAALLALVAVTTAVLVAGCANDSMLITLVVRVCALQGSDLAARPAAERDAAVAAEFDTVNTDIWSQARIAFVGCCEDVPVVRDPFADASPLASRALGSATIAPGDRISTEMAQEAAECATAWAARRTAAGTGAAAGPVVVLVHDITTADGVTSTYNGVTSERPDPATDLCVEPRALSPTDVTPRYSFVIEPSGFGRADGWHAGLSYVTLAHELGHQLLLFHGDGLDARGRAAPPAGPGPRRFDECDPGERDHGDSLMDATQFGNHPATALTAYQIELAREAAVEWPGHVGPLPAP